MTGPVSFYICIASHLDVGVSETLIKSPCSSKVQQGDLKTWNRIQWKGEIYVWNNVPTVCLMRDWDKLTLWAWGSKKKLDQFGSVCMYLNSNSSLKHNIKICSQIYQEEEKERQDRLKLKFWGKIAFHVLIMNWWWSMWALWCADTTPGVLKVE